MTIKIVSISVSVLYAYAYMYMCMCNVCVCCIICMYKTEHILTMLICVDFVYVFMTIVVIYHIYIIYIDLLL